MAIGAAAFSELVTAAYQRIDPKDLQDQIFTTHPTLEILSKNLKNVTGRSLVMNLEGADLDSSEWTDDSGTFSTSVDGDIAGAAEYAWSSPLVGKTRLNYMTIQKNQGKEQIVDLVRAHIENMKKSHQNKLVTAIHALASATVSGQFHSLDELVSDETYDTAQSLTVGGIDSSAASYWQASRLEVPLDHTTMGTGDIRKAFRYVRNELAVNNSSRARVTHVICGRDIFEELEDSFDDAVRYVSFEKGQTRFRAIYDGDIEVRLDPDCPVKRAYFLDADKLTFASLNGNWMKLQEPQKITGTLDYVTPLATVAAFGTSERRAHAVLLRPTTAGGAA